MSRLIRMRRSCGTPLRPSVMRTSSFPPIGRMTTRPIRAPSRHFCNLTVLARRASVRFCGTTVLASIACNKSEPNIFEFFVWVWPGTIAAQERNRSTKSENRNSKQFLNDERQNELNVANRSDRNRRFEFSELSIYWLWFVSDFDIRISSSAFKSGRESIELRMFGGRYALYPNLCRLPRRSLLAAAGSLHVERLGGDEGPHALRHGRPQGASVGDKEGRKPRAHERHGVGRARVRSRKNPPLRPHGHHRSL